MTKRCDRCRRPFQPQKSFHRRCWDCWKADQDDAVRSDGYRRGYADGLRDAQSAGQAMGSSLAKRAALLCHPDRHPDGRKREATEVTQALLDVANGGRRFEARSLGR